MTDEIKISLKADEDLIDFLHQRIKRLESEVKYLKEKQFPSFSIAEPPETIAAPYSQMQKLNLVCRVSAKDNKAHCNTHVITEFYDKSDRFEWSYFINDTSILKFNHAKDMLINLHKQLINILYGEKNDK